jgi:Na+-driven multidrug efflux pump
MGIGIPNGIENSVFQIGKILVLTLMAGFGTSAVAANAAATALTNFNALPGLAMELAIIPVVGQALGAGKPHEAIYLNRKLIIITYVLMIIVNIPLIITTKQIMGIFNLNEQTEILAINMYTFHNIVAMLIWPLSFVMPVTLRTANDAKFTMIISFISMWAMRVGLSYLFSYFTDWGGMCIWYAMAIDWTLRSFFFVFRWRRGRWKQHYAIE